MTSSGFVLVDTGRPNRRSEIEEELKRAGCHAGDLRLIVLTHGDFDHSSNAAYFREKFGSRIAMHRDDSGMVEHGDMLWNRGKRNILAKAAFGLMFRLGESERFVPDQYIGEGCDLSEIGFEAKVIEIPGHSRGSIGILSGSGELFCGDLLANVGKPGLWSIIDDRGAAEASVEKLRRLPITTVFPGHGPPFMMEELWKNYPGASGK